MAENRKKAFVSQNRQKSNTVHTLVPLFVTVLILVVVIAGVMNVSAASDEEQLNAMEQAVRRSVVQCYAIEGRYPNNLEYLAENYGLMLDREKFVYHYQVYGANLLPDITVLKKG